MDDTSRGLRDELMTGRGDEATRNYAGTPGTPAPADRLPSDRATAPAGPRSTTAGSAADGPAGAGDLDPETDRRAREIRAEIAQTREDMSETIEAIQEKLSPGNLATEAKEKVMTATTEGVRHMTDLARETAESAWEGTRQMAGEFAEGARKNAIPAAMIGVGAAWLVFDRFREGNRRRDWRSDASRGYDSSRTQRSSGGRDYRAGAAREAGDYGTESYPVYGGGRSHVFEGTSSRIDEAREAAMRTGRRARSRFQRLLQSNPLMVGAAALAVGAAIGLALPETERENEWLGEARDSVVDRAQDMAKGAASQVREAAGELAGQVTSQVVKGEG